MFSSIIHYKTHSPTALPPFPRNASEWLPPFLAHPKLACMQSVLKGFEQESLLGLERQHRALKFSLNPTGMHLQRKEN